MKEQLIVVVPAKPAYKQQHAQCRGKHMMMRVPVDASAFGEKFILSHLRLQDPSLSICACVSAYRQFLAPGENKYS